MHLDLETQILGLCFELYSTATIIDRSRPTLFTWRPRPLRHIMSHVKGCSESSRNYLLLVFHPFHVKTFEAGFVRIPIKYCLTHLGVHFCRHLINKIHKHTLIWGWGGVGGPVYLICTMVDLGRTAYRMIYLFCAHTHRKENMLSTEEVNAS